MASPTAATWDRSAPGAAELRYAQLGPGRCRGRRADVRTARLHLTYESWSLGVLKMGRGLRGWVTFLVPGGGGPARIQGRRVEPGEVMVFFAGDEFHYRSAGEAQLVSVGVERATLERHVRALLDGGVDELRLQGRLSGLRADHDALRGLCLALAGPAAARPGRVRGLEKLEAILVNALLAGLEGPRAPDAAGPGRALAMKAEAWLRQNLAEPPTVASLCEALGASERTLHAAFREHLDDTPKSYLKTLRLNAARQDLLEGRAGRRVTDVALDWGFVHLGWFSQDYRRHFGETPSQTLQFARARFGRAPYPTVPVRPRADRTFHRPYRGHRSEERSQS